jgi:hypothetical protein
MTSGLRHDKGYFLSAYSGNFLSGVPTQSRQIPLLENTHAGPNAHPYVSNLNDRGGEAVERDEIEERAKRATSPSRNL